MLILRDGLASEHCAGALADGDVRVARVEHGLEDGGWL